MSGSGVAVTVSGTDRASGGGEGRLDLPLSAYAAVMRRLPVMSGTTRLSYNRVTKQLIGDKRSATARIEGRIPIEVDLSEYHGRVLYLFGTNDPKVRAACRALSRPGDVFMDVGANYSSIGFAVAPVVGEGGAVHLFEPQPRFEARLRGAIAASGHANVRLHPVGLLDEAGTIEMAVPPRHSGMATMAEDRFEDGWDRVVVEVREVTGVVAEVASTRPLGAKVDIEGVEPRVLPALLSAPGFGFVVFEGCSNQDDLFGMTTTYGVAMYGLERSPLRLSARRVSCRQGMDDHHDFLFVPARAGLPARARGADAIARLRSGDA